MAQEYNFENTTQGTVNFSTVQNGEMFLYADAPYIKLDNNNPNAAKLQGGDIVKMEDDDQVICPDCRIIKFE